MKNFQQKRGFRNIAHSRPVLVFFSILLFIFAWGVLRFMGKMQVTIENRKMAENKVAKLEEQKKEFSTDIAKLKTTDGIEESIREKFPVAKEGEGMIVVVEDKNIPETIKQDRKGFFSFFTNWFK